MTAAAGSGWLPVDAGTCLLVVAPHPDDETLANGLLLQRVLAAGGRVHVLLLTDGDNNPWPQRWLEHRWRVDAAARARWALRRRREMDAALRVLGVPASALTALGWPDLGVARQLRDPAAQAVAALTAVLARVAPNRVAMPALGDRHPDHGAAHVLMRQALAAWGQPVSIGCYHLHGEAAQADSAEHGDAAQRTVKQQALAAHASQLVLSGRRMRQWALRAEHHVPLPAAAVGARCLPWRPPRLLRPHLWLTAATLGGVVMRWRFARAPLVRDDAGRWRLAWPALATGEVGFVHLSLDLPTPWIFDHWGWCEI